jgi:hypothetical protein
MRKNMKIKTALLLFAIALSFAFVSADMSAEARPCGSPCCGIDCGGGVMAIGQYIGGQCFLTGGRCNWPPRGPCDDTATGCP